MKKLYRSDDSKLFGVCAGIAEHFDIDPTVIRVIAVVCTLFSSGMGVPAYIIMALIIPPAPKNDVY